MDFKAKYNRTNFISFFRDSLLPEDFTQETELIALDFKSNYFNEVTYLGGCPSLDLSVYEIRHSSEKDARVGLSRDAFKLISRYSTNNALILFVPDNPSNFRLSLVTIEPKLDEKGIKILKEYSNPRRYSFALGEDAKTHTPEQYLIGFGRIADNTDLKKRFSVEVVNKEFYGQIAAMFSQLVGGKRRKGSKTIEFDRSLVLPSVAPENDQKYKEFAVRLIGRTVFCWFLKKKKSGNGVPLIDDNVLSAHQADNTPNFYHARVEPLFFEILNTPLEKRKPEFRVKPFADIPFLNGGLFEPHTDDFYLNGQPNYALKIPDQWWKDFLDILETYNFTIDENTSIDIDLSVDPEMLGRIFENLLAEINPETGETARKATGSYYTPRPIVEYMVDQSLKQYLITKTGIEEAKFNTLLDYSNESSGLTTEEEKRVIEALNTIKILDPACGSGAFPMGMLQKMLLILQKVDHEATNSILQVLNEINDPTYREIIRQKLDAAKVFDSDNLSNYARKLSVIQRSIYGVDIQPVAIDISKLRFFLSLVVDEVIQDDKPNRGVEALPNLEFKFVCANTLIPLPEPDSFERMFGDAELVKGLEEIRNRYFTATNADKPKLKQLFEALQNKLYLFLTKNRDVLKNPNGRLQLLASWKPFAEDTTPWFDPKWMFGIETGFDVVIGNPPYGIVYDLNIKSIYESNYSTFKRNNDIYVAFFERSIEILREKGNVILITPNTFLNGEYFKILRKYFREKTVILEVVDFKNSKIFLDPTVFVCITSLMLLKNKTLPYQSIIKVSNDDFSKTENHSLKIHKANELPFKPFNQIIDKIFAKRDVCFLLDERYYVKDVGFNYWTIGKGKKRDGDSIGDRIFYSGQKENIKDKPFLKGKDIHKYYHAEPTNFLRNDFNDYLKDGVDVFRYSGNFLEKSPKIIYRQTSNKIIATIDSNENLCDKTVHVIVPKIQNEKIKFLLALINSTLFDYLYKDISQEKEGRTFAQVKTIYIKQLPIIKTKQEIQDLLISQVDKILSKKSDNPLSLTKNIEVIIDLMVYKLYELTYDEVMVVDPDIERIINREDYERMGVEELGDYKIEI